MSRYSGSVTARGASRRIVHRLVTLALVALATAIPPNDGSAQPAPTLPNKDLMETTITDASNAIWNAYDPPASEEQWATLAAAAQALIAATKTATVGGTGPMDNE